MTSSGAMNEVLESLLHLCDAQRKYISDGEEACLDCSGVSNK